MESINIKIRVHKFTKNSLPKDGQHVVWIWFEAGLFFAGDFYNGKVRLAHQGYAINASIDPTHWIDDNEFWNILDIQ